MAWREQNQSWGCQREWAQVDHQPPRNPRAAARFPLHASSGNKSIATRTPCRAERNQPDRPDRPSSDAQPAHTPSRHATRDREVGYVVVDRKLYTRSWTPTQSVPTSPAPTHLSPNRALHLLPRRRDSHEPHLSLQFPCQTATRPRPRHSSRLPCGADAFAPFPQIVADRRHCLCAYGEGSRDGMTSGGEDRVVVDLQRSGG